MMIIDIYNPASLQASTIVWALTDRLKILGIENSTSEEVLSINREKMVHIF